ncbi:hypothetical protein AB0883_15685 [Micromonospora sp. NPDC047812]|uniref:hypothetical protein n=1 Tax=Micromonospora sp. NPDC047812 TaxID=3155742 RepID=UPI003454B565
MQDSIDADTIISEIDMIRTNDSRAIVLVEGPEDIAALDPHLKESECFTLPTTGNSILMGAIRIADDRRMAKVVAISDLDWTGILYPAYNSPNVIYTDDYDLDATLMNCPGIVSRITSSHCDREKVRQLLERTGTGSIFYLATQISAIIGALRLASIRDGLQLKLRHFPVEKVIDWQTYTVDPRKLAVEAITRTTNCSISPDELEMIIKSEAAQILNPLRYCSGHDLIATFATIIRRSCGGSAGADSLSRALRAAFSCADLQSTGLYFKLDSWAKDRGINAWGKEPDCFCATT